MCRRVCPSLTGLLILTLLLGACGRTQGATTPPTVSKVTVLSTGSTVAGPTPRATEITATATGTATVSPTPTPVQEGRLPSLRARLDLGVPGGNAYGPSAMAVDEEGVAYVACMTCEGCAERQAAISVVDLRTGSVRDVWPLPGGVPGPLAVGAGWLYATYQDETFASRLVVLDTTTGRVRADVGIEWISSEARIGLDVAHQRLYLPVSAGIEVRDLQSLEVVDTLAYPGTGFAPPVVYDALANRLYLAMGSTLYAYQASALSIAWQTDLPVAGIEDLLLDASGDALLVKSAATDPGAPASRFLVVGADGRLQHDVRPSGVGVYWDLAWADARAARIVLQETEWAQSGQSSLRLTVVDLEGRSLDQRLTLWGGHTVAGAPRDGALYALGRSAHSLVAIEGASLARGANLALGVELRDVALGSSTGALYVNDTSGRLYEIDAERAADGTLSVRRSVTAGGGPMLLDEEGGRLLVAEAAGDAQRVSVVALADLQVTTVITGGDQLALDTTRGRALVGSAWSGYPPGEGQVQVWDLESGRRVGAIPLGGEPAYNPVRDEIYVAGYSCHVYSAETLAETGSLTPDIDAQECKGCSGQDAVLGVEVFEDHNTLVLEMIAVVAGHGAGTNPSPRTFALDTLSPTHHAVTLLSNSVGDLLAWAPVGGRVLESVTFARYVTRSNLVAWGADSDERLAWWDGLSLEWLTPDGGTGFIERDGRWLALDMESMTPLGYLPRYDVRRADAQRGTLLAIDGAALSLLAAGGGEPEASAGPIAATVGAGPRGVAFSPAFGSDRTLFVVGDRNLYRSQDAGMQWERLQGGLPALEYGGPPGASLVVSPDYARDGTLFWGGCDSGSAGMGVWRSDDGGDTWQPVWAGLRHLCVERLVISPAYASDGSLVAYCQYTDLTGGEWGKSVWVSRDRGATWSLAASTADEWLSPLPQPDVLFGVAMPASPVGPGYGYSAVGTGTGDEFVETLTFPSGEWSIALALSPEFVVDRTLYVLSTYHLYRSLDGGSTWSVAGGGALDGLDGGTQLAALAATQASAGGHVALLDEAGHCLVLASDLLTWEPVVRP